MTGDTTARNPAITLPTSISARVIGVMEDNKYWGPFRKDVGPKNANAELGQRGFAGVDSFLWLKGGKILASEDSYGPGGFNMGVLYDIASKKGVPIVGAIGKDGITTGKMNSVAMAPFGSFSGPTNQEMTGFYDASASLSVSVPYTPQDIYDAYDAKHIVVNNQMKGASGPMEEGFYYSAQTHMLILPDVNFSEDSPLYAPYTLTDENEAHFVTAYGKYRRKLATRKLKSDDGEIYDDWHLGHLDLDTTHH